MSEQQAYFVKIRGRTLGPFDVPRIRQMIQQGQISRINPVSADGHQWQKAGEFASLFQAEGGQSRTADVRSASSDQAAANRTTVESANREASGPKAEPSSQTGTWYYSIGDQQVGPVTANIVRELIRNGQLSSHDHAWREGMVNWSTVAEIPELAVLLPSRSTLDTHAVFGTAAQSQVTADFRETKMIISYSSGWLSFIYIFTYVAAALNLIGACILVVLAFRESSSLAEARILLARSLMSVFMGAFLATTAYFLHRYANAMDQFRRTEHIGDLNLGFRWIGRYRLLYGVCLIITLFLAAITAVLAVAVPGLVPWPFI